MNSVTVIYKDYPTAHFVTGENATKYEGGDCWNLVHSIIKDENVLGVAYGPVWDSRQKGWIRGEHYVTGKRIDDFIRTGK